MFLITCSVVSCSSVNKVNDVDIGADIVTDINNNEQELVTGSEKDNGGTNVCMVHSSEYHCFSSYLTDYVGDDAFMEWYESTNTSVNNTDNGCLYPEQNIYEFIRYFDIPKEVLIDLYNEYLLPYYNIDLLYGGTAQEVDQFYRSISDEQKIEEIKFSNLNELKINILLENLDVFSDNTNINSYSLIEMMYITKTPVDRVKSIITSQDRSDNSNVFYSQFDYNFDVFDEKNETDINRLIEEHSPFYLDCLLCGLTPYETKYDKQVSDNEKIFELAGIWDIE